MMKVRRKMNWSFGGVLAAALVLATLCVAGQASAAPNLVLNGSFTLTSTASPGGYICNGTADCSTAAGSNVTNWTSNCSTTGACGGHATPSSILYAGTNGSAFNGGFGLQTAPMASPDGGNYIAIDSDPQYTSYLAQTINGLTVGASYLVTFYQAADTQSGNTAATTDQFTVSLGGSSQTAALITDSGAGGNFFTGWTQQSLTFIATSTSEALKFVAIGTPAGYPPVALLDGVTLSQVPEPAAWSMLFVGVAGLLIARYRPRLGSRNAA